MLSHNESPDIGFDWSLNPYRGCTHACAYCYARPTHEFLGWGAGSDFDRRIVVKTNAAELLRRELTRPSWKGEAIAFSGVTDCYQPLERHYELTRRCLEVCVERRNPVSIVTKSCLIERDLDLLKRLPSLRVHLSIAFADDNVGRALEPFVPRASRRLETLRKLADAGLDVGVIAAPLIPGLNDHDLPSLLDQAAEAGARFASITMLRLPSSVLSVFEERLAENCPEHADRVWSAIRAARRGQHDDSRFGHRFVGQRPALGARRASLRGSVPAARPRSPLRRHGPRRDSTPRAKANSSPIEPPLLAHGCELAELRPSTEVPY